MSHNHAAEGWIKSEEKPYGLGAGMPHWCVKYVKCPHCEADPGELCEGSRGPILGHHFKRFHLYRDEQRAGRVPRDPRFDTSEALLRIKTAIEQAEASERADSESYHRHFITLAVQNLAKAVELLARGGKS